MTHQELKRREGLRVDGLDRPRMLAERLLAWWHARQQISAVDHTLDVDAIVAALGLALATFASSLHPDTLGYLEPGEDLIFLRETLPEGTRRFTLAHELGHALLHRTSGSPARLARELSEGRNGSSEPLSQCLTSDMDIPIELASGLDEVLAPGHAYSARSRRESEANAFAAALLLPTSLLKHVYLDAPTASVNTTELATRLGVPEDVLLRRLTALLVGDELRAAPHMEPLGTVPTLHERLEGLDAEQRAACEGSAPALVLAGPGTGKTSTLVGRAAHLISVKGVSPSSILALTFSNKAAAEMSERLRALLAGGHLEQGEPTVSTIHAFCGDLLRKHGHLVGLRPDFRLRATADGFLMLRTITREAPLRHYQPITAPTMSFRDLLGAFSRANDELITPGAYVEASEKRLARARTVEERIAAEKVAEVASTWEAYQQRLEALGDLDFGGVLVLAVRLLREQPDILAAVRARFSHILVDEFQDINRAMGILLRTLAGEDGAIWAVGDPDQAIYRFRGASPANIRRFSEDYPHAATLSLRQNYRSYQQILNGAAQLATDYLSRGQRTPLRAVRGSALDSPVSLAEADTGEAERASIVADIQARLAAGKKPTDIAILCRTGREVQEQVRVLREAGLPVRVVAPLLEQDEVKDLLAIVSLLAEPTGGGLLRAGKLDDHPYSREEALAVIEAARQQEKPPVIVLREGLTDVRGLSAHGRMGLLTLNTMLRAMLQSSGVASGLARYIFGLTGLGRRLMQETANGDPVARERALHLSRLIALARAFEDQRTQEMSANQWAGFMDYVQVHVLLGEDARGGEDLYASAEEGIWVLTVHASKGLEFPVVYLPHLTNGTFPSRLQPSRMPLPSELIDEPELSEQEAHTIDEACLFYVAITRARDKLILSWAKQYKKRKEAPSNFLKPLQAALGPTLRRLHWSVPGHTEGALARDDATTPAGRYQFDAGELESYDRCPRQYAYQYVWGLRRPTNAYAALTRAVRALQKSFAEQTAEHHLSLADAQEQFETHLNAALPSGNPDPFEALYRREGRVMVQQLWNEAHKRLAPGESFTQEIGQETDVRVGAYEVSVPLDRVDRATGEGHGESAARRLVRQRLARSSASPDLRTYFYTLAAEQGGEHAAQVSNHTLPTGDVAPLTLTQAKRSSLQQEALSAIEGINAQEFTAKVEPRTCAGCPFLFICPA